MCTGVYFTYNNKRGKREENLVSYIWDRCNRCPLHHHTLLWDHSISPATLYSQSWMTRRAGWPSPSKPHIPSPRWPIQDHWRRQHHTRSWFQWYQGQYQFGRVLPPHGHPRHRSHSDGPGNPQVEGIIIRLTTVLLGSPSWLIGQVLIPILLHNKYIFLGGGGAEYVTG